MKTTANIGPVPFIVPPNGNVSNHKQWEARGFEHTDKTPTGLYVRQGDTLTIQVDKDGLALNIGQWGTYAHVNPGEDISFTTYHLTSGANTVTFTKGTAMIYFLNTTEDQTFLVSIDGAQPAPTFRMDQTSQADWLIQLDTLTEAPFAELISDHILATYQYSLVNTPEARTLEINNALKNWDTVYRMQNQVHGLIEGGTGVATKYDNRIHFITPDTGAGYAYATAWRVGYQKDTGAAAEILSNSAKLTSPGSWTVFHEVGHTYQNQLYKPSYAGEVTVNIPAHIINEMFGLESRFDQNKRNYIQAFIDSDDPEKNFADPDPAKDSAYYPFDNDAKLWVRLGMYIQLHYGYGEHFYPRLNQQYRILISPNLSGDEIKMQHFALHASLVSGRNLTPFFTRWGIYPTAEIIEQIQHLPEPAAAIWENILSDTPIVDRFLPDYRPPSAQVHAGDYVIGETLSAPDLDRFISTIHVAVPPYTMGWVTENNVAKNTKLSIIIRDSEENQNRFNIPINFCYGQALSFIGYNRTNERLILTLRPDDHTLKMFYDTEDLSSIDSGIGQFCQLSFYSSSGEMAQTFSVNREDNGVAFAAEMTGQSYENGQSVFVQLYADRHLAAFQDNLPILMQSDSVRNVYFRIEDNKFHLLSDVDIKPKGTPVPTITDIGTPVNADTLVKDVEILFGTQPIIEFTSEPNIYLPGQVMVSVVIRDALGNETELDVPLTVRYNTAISMNAYALQERAVLRINARQQTIEAFSNPAINTILQNGTGKYFEVTQYNVDLVEKKKVHANREEKPFDFVSALNQTPYEEEDYLHIHIAERGKITAYVMNNQLFPREESTTDEWFRIAFGELKRVPSPL